MRPARLHPRHCRRVRRAARRRGTGRRARSPPGRCPRDPRVHRFQRLHALGSSGSARALGRWVRADGSGHRRGLCRSIAGFCDPVGSSCDRAFQRRSRRRAAGDGPEARRVPGCDGGNLCRSRPIRPRPRCHHAPWASHDACRLSVTTRLRLRIALSNSCFGPRGAPPDRRGHVRLHRRRRRGRHGSRVPPRSP